MEGFLLGLGSGTACMAYCYPVLLPYILSEGKALRAGYGRLAFFLAGRLMGYIAIGAVSGAIGGLLTLSKTGAAYVAQGTTLLIALLLILRPLLRRKKRCDAMCIQPQRDSRQKDWWFPLVLGLCTGLSICPPFMMGVTRAFLSGGIWQGITFFLFFYGGTLVYFLPLPLAGLIGKKINIRFIADIAMVLMGFYYLYIGVIGIIALI